MDSTTKVKLESLRSNVPRFLFRGWHAESGGDAKLNTTTAITPGHFFHTSSTNVFDRTTKEFIQDAASHASNYHVPTSFSSWTASISLAMRFCADHPDSSHIGIIDTTMLKDKNQVFLVSDLKFLSPFMVFDDEYIAYGTIQGPYYRAVPYQAFTNMGLVIYVAPKVKFIRDGSMYTQIRKVLQSTSATGKANLTEELVHRCREMGEKYGSWFAMPMTLALIARLMEATEPKDDPKAYRLIEAALKDDHANCDWLTDIAVMTDFANFKEFPEVTRFLEPLQRFARLEQSKDQARAEDKPKKSKANQANLGSDRVLRSKTKEAAQK